MGGLEIGEGKHFVRQWLDVKDKEGAWLEAQVVMIKDGELRVSFKGYASEYDEWLPKGSMKIAALHTHTRQLNDRDSMLGTDLKADFPIGTDLDVRDSTDEWLPAHVINVDGRYGMVEVRYDNFPSDYDEWINVESYRLARAGVHTREERQKGSRQYDEGMDVEHESSGVPSTHQMAVVPRKGMRLVASQDVEGRYRSAVKRMRNLEVHDMAADGNCLFRTISHQVYGDASHHGLVRAKIMEYIETEAGFFRQYVFDEDFAAYLARLKRPGEWGGEVEVRAACEMYGRQVEIYHYSLEPKEVYRPPEVIITPDITTSSSPAPIPLRQSEAKGSASHATPAEGKTPLPRRNYPDIKTNQVNIERKLKMSLENIDEDMSPASPPFATSTPTENARTPTNTPLTPLSPGSHPSLADTKLRPPPPEQSRTNAEETTADRAMPPIRLSYHWNSHYNSLVNPADFPVLTVIPGKVEDRGIALSQNRHRDRQTKEAKALEEALAVSRREFENRDLNQFFKHMLIGQKNGGDKAALEKAMSLSLKEEEEKLKGILDKTRKEAEQQQEREIQIAKNRSVEEVLDQAKVQSLMDAESNLLEKAVADSLREQEQKQMALVLAQSTKDFGKKRNRNVDLGEEAKLAMALGMDMDDDMAIQRAIEASMRQTG